MLEAALKLCPHVERMLMDDLDNLRNEYLTPAEWTELEIIHQFLWPFEQATQACEGDDATLDSMLYMDMSMWLSEPCKQQCCVSATSTSSIIHTIEPCLLST